MSNRFILRRGLGVPPPYDTNVTEGLRPFELGYSIDKKLLYIHHQKDTMSEIIPLGGVVKQFNDKLSLSSLSQYELGFLTTDNLVYIKKGDDTVIPVGCVPTNFRVAPPSADVPLGYTVNVQLMGNGMSTIETGPIPVELPIASATEEGVLSLTTQKIVGEKTLWGSTSSLNFQINDKDRAMKWQKQPNGNLTLYLVDEES